MGSQILRNRSPNLRVAVCTHAPDGTNRAGYQVTKGTWSKLKSRLGLRDFSPASQDAAAIELLRETGALQYAEQGNVAAAVSAARRIWASLPGAGYDQPERSLAWLQARYTESGGVLA